MPWLNIWKYIPFAVNKAGIWSLVRYAHSPNWSCKASSMSSISTLSALIKHTVLLIRLVFGRWWDTPLHLIGSGLVNHNLGPGIVLSVLWLNIRKYIPFAVNKASIWSLMRYAPSPNWFGLVNHNQGPGTVLSVLWLNIRKYIPFAVNKASIWSLMRYTPSSNWFGSCKS